MKVKYLGFGSVEIDGETYDYDVVVRGGRVKKRKKKLSKHLKELYGHTPLSLAENIPWDCKTLIIGTGESGALPVLDEIKAEAENRGMTLVIMKTEEACRGDREGRGKTNALLHLTC
ncbi:MAG: hypothetical protein KKD46_05520 [Euryarchaeota archaeon]|nr:hypothetical protein [Euryarchaeota archaeon]MBU4340359.1 hypothetical protein [Euryarchaeota archaeon]MBU4453985.1 hypothetical protein [Euryarchaeota archaeon]MCG2736584.1 MTH938/NDUFAF3 family protein [Candidatus Methanoperedenaceae archaeon]